MSRKEWGSFCFLKSFFFVEKSSFNKKLTLSPSPFSTPKTKKLKPNSYIVLVAQVLLAIVTEAVVIGVIFARISHPQQRARTIGEFYFLKKKKTKIEEMKKKNSP